MTLLIYNLGIKLYAIGIFLVSFFHKKAKRWHEGRKGLFEKITAALQENTNPILWFHTASLGEFEQARPVIEKLQQQSPNAFKVLITFFSPSGYEVRKDHPIADFVFYLPLDTPANARRFLDLVQPQAVFFVKYEFWYHYLAEVQKRKIPLILFSAVFRLDQVFFRWYGDAFRRLLAGFSHIFVQNEYSLKLLVSLGIRNASIASDTRFDRVQATSLAARDISEAAIFKDNKKLLVIGSCWGKDLDVLLPALNVFPHELKVIIAPHEIKEGTLRRIEHELKKKTIRHSQIEGEDLRDYEILLIDNIGMLSALYRYGTIAYVGGAFREGLHNILEPATFGLPIIFGKKYQKYPEAADLIEKGGAFSIKNVDEFMSVLRVLYVYDERREEAGQLSAEYISQNTGGADKIQAYVSEHCLP